MATGPVPKNEPALLLWLTNFATKLPLHPELTTVSTAMVNSAVADCNYLVWLIQTWVPAFVNFTEQAVSFKDAIKNGPAGAASGPPPVMGAFATMPPTTSAGALPRLRALAQTIKNDPAYLAATGQDLNIIAPATPSPAVAAAPVLTLAKAIAGDVVIKYNKGRWTGVAVRGRIGDSGPFADLGTDLTSPFNDRRPLATPGVPEIRQYQMCYLDGETPTGVWSDILVATVS